jgi:hypothetical protein
LKKLILLFTCVLILVGCAVQQNEYEQAFIKNIKALDDKTEVVLNDITPFDWDVVYSFAPYTSKEDIQKTIGFEAKVQETVNEGMLHLIFVKDKKVEYEIMDYPSNLGINIITFSDSICYKDNAHFKVKTEEDIIYLTEDNVWSSIENKEWSTHSMHWGIGSGVYFYSENAIKYAVSMAYGSGVAVIDAYTSEVTIQGNKITFDIPNRLISNDLPKDETSEISLLYNNDGLLFDKIKFEYNPEYPTFHYDQWIEYSKMSK